MCATSMITDHTTTIIPNRYPELFAQPGIVGPQVYFDQTPVRLASIESQLITLRNELLELKKLIQAAQAYDRATGQEECESEEKIDKLRKICDVAGIDLSDILITKK